MFAPMARLISSRRSRFQSRAFTYPGKGAGYEWPRLESASSESTPVPTVDKIGDCDALAIIVAAVYTGHRYARELGTDRVYSDVGR